MKDKYTVSDMVLQAHRYFDIVNTKENKSASREKIIRYLRDNDLYDGNTERVGTRVFHYFDACTVSETLYVGLEKYFSKRAGDAYRRLKEFNDDFDRIPPDVNDDISTYQYVSGDFQNRLNEIMLTALFNKYFSIDIDQLRRDLMTVQEAPEGDYNMQQMTAYKKTCTTERILENYVHKKR